MRAINHRFALGSSPALPSALSKKSLASVSSPILACRDFTSTGAASAPALGSGPNTPAAPSRSCAFQCLIWLGWTSNCCASSARVFSPFRAARATLALKAGEWFRRGRLLIVSPVRQPFWLRSGRNSTYLTGQILRASSMEDGAPPHRSRALAPRGGNAGPTLAFLWIGRLEIAHFGQNTCTTAHRHCRLE